MKRFASTLSDLEKKFKADTNVDVERAAHDALHLRAALDGAVDGLRDGDRVSFVQGCPGQRRPRALPDVAPWRRRRVRRDVLPPRQSAERRAPPARAARRGRARPRPAAGGLLRRRVLDAFVRATYTRGRLDGVERGVGRDYPRCTAQPSEFVERCGAALRIVRGRRARRRRRRAGVKGCPRRRRARGAAARSEATAARVFIRRRFIVRGRIGAASARRCWRRSELSGAL